MKVDAEGSHSAFGLTRNKLGSSQGLWNVCKGGGRGGGGGGTKTISSPFLSIQCLGLLLYFVKVGGAAAPLPPMLPGHYIVAALSTFLPNQSAPANTSRCSLMVVYFLCAESDGEAAAAAAAGSGQPAVSRGPGAGQDTQSRELPPGEAQQGRQR